MDEKDDSEESHCRSPKTDVKELESSRTFETLKSVYESSPKVSSHQPETPTTSTGANMVKNPQDNPAPDSNVPVEQNIPTRTSTLTASEKDCSQPSVSVSPGLANLGTVQRISISSAVVQPTMTCTTSDTNLGVQEKAALMSQYTQFSLDLQTNINTKLLPGVPLQSPYNGSNNIPINTTLMDHSSVNKNVSSSVTSHVGFSKSDTKFLQNKVPVTSVLKTPLIPQTVLDHEALHAEKESDEEAMETQDQQKHARREAADILAGTRVSTHNISAPQVISHTSTRENIIAMTKEHYLGNLSRGPPSGASSLVAATESMLHSLEGSTAPQTASTPGAASPRPSESDMDTESDSDSRLVVDSDTRTDDGNEYIASDDDMLHAQVAQAPLTTTRENKLETLQRPKVISQHPQSGTEHSVTKTYPNLTQANVATSAAAVDATRGIKITTLQPAALVHQHSLPANIPMTINAPVPLALKNLHPGSPLVQRSVKLDSLPSGGIIPSVVSDMDPSTESVPPKTRKLVTPGNVKNSAAPTLSRLLDGTKKISPTAKGGIALSSEDSLLKVNKPHPTSPSAIRSHLVQTMESPDQRMRSLPSKFEMKPGMMTQFQETTFQMQPPNVPTHVQDLVSQKQPLYSQLKTESSTPKDNIVMRGNTNVPRPQILPIEIKPEIPFVSKSSDVSTPGMDKSEDVKPTTPAFEGPELLKDSGSSEEQVNAILKKYNIFGPAEKREVSVKDMRRVIPQLIMCLFSKDDHHARKVKGLWEKKPSHWPKKKKVPTATLR